MKTFTIKPSRKEKNIVNIISNAATAAEDMEMGSAISTGQAKAAIGGAYNTFDSHKGDGFRSFIQIAAFTADAVEKELTSCGWTKVA